MIKETVGKNPFKKKSVTKKEILKGITGVAYSG